MIKSMDFPHGLVVLEDLRCSWWVPGAGQIHGFLWWFGGAGGDRALLVAPCATPACPSLLRWPCPVLALQDPKSELSWAPSPRIWRGGADSRAGDKRSVCH